MHATDTHAPIPTLTCSTILLDGQDDEGNSDPNCQYEGKIPHPAANCEDLFRRALDQYGGDAAATDPETGAPLQSFTEYYTCNGGFSQQLNCEGCPCADMCCNYGQCHFGKQACEDKQSSDQARQILHTVANAIGGICNAITNKALGLCSGVLKGLNYLIDAAMDITARSPFCRPTILLFYFHTLS